MTNYSLNIADYTIRFSAVNDTLNFAPSEAQQSFITKNPVYDLVINVFIGQVNVKKEAVAVFRAPYIEEIDGIRLKKDDEFWTVYKLGDYILIRISHLLSKKHKEALLIIRPGENSWDLIIDSSDTTIDPFCYPLDGLIIYYLTALNGDIFIHGSGVEHKGKAYLFPAKSGQGKTTIASIFNKQGAKVIHDDRLIIRQINNQVLMYNTPVYNNEISSKTALSRIYLIEHGRENLAFDLPTSDAITNIMANCIQHHWNTDLIANLTGALLNLVNSVQVRKLSFVPDNSVIEYIEKESTL